MYPFSPSMIAATEITLVTPITMPRIVSADRILRERSVSSATSRFSLTSLPVIVSLRPERNNRVELRRLHRRINAEEQADEGAEKHSEASDPDLNRSGKGRELPERERACEADPNSHAAPQQALEHAFRKKLPQDILLCGS